MKEALWWQTEDDGKHSVHPVSAFLPLGRTARLVSAYIRKNVGGKLYSLGYGTSTGFAVDPIEKSP